jgi:hypothetical protein
MLTISTNFDFFLDVIVDTWALKPVPTLVITLSAVLGPLEEDFKNHKDVHRDYTEI